MKAPVAQLLAELCILGVAVVPDGEHLRVSPKSALTGDLVVRILELKQELLSVLAKAPPKDLLVWATGLTWEEWHTLEAIAGRPGLSPARLRSATGLTKKDQDLVLKNLQERREAQVQPTGRCYLFVH